MENPRTNSPTLDLTALEKIEVSSRLTMADLKTLKTHIHDVKIMEAELQTLRKKFKERNRNVE